MKQESAAMRGLIRGDWGRDMRLRRGRSIVSRHSADVGPRGKVLPLPRRNHLDSCVPLLSVRSRVRLQQSIDLKRTIG